MPYENGQQNNHDGGEIASRIYCGIKVLNKSIGGRLHDK